MALRSVPDIKSKDKFKFFANGYFQLRWPECIAYDSFMVMETV